MRVKASEIGTWLRVVLNLSLVSTSCYLSSETLVFLFVLGSAGVSSLFISSRGCLLYILLIVRRRSCVKHGNGGVSIIICIYHLSTSHNRRRRLLIIAVAARSDINHRRISDEKRQLSYDFNMCDVWVRCLCAGARVRMCACVHACVRACVRACVWVCKPHCVQLY